MSTQTENYSQQPGQNNQAGQNNKDTSASTTEKFAAKAHETVDRVAERTAATVRDLRDRAERASARVHETEERAKAIAGDTARSLESYIERNPLMSAGAAFVAGLVLSGLLRR
jgi:ElaB/YqjD/DUF883 family membrane-anchored ribosome-binding protein